MIQLFTDNEALILRLKILSIEVIHVTDMEAIKPKSVVLCDKESGYTLIYKRDDLNILILSEFPKFEEGKKFLQLGVKGYANIYSHKKHLLQAIEVISGGNIWLYPDFMTSLISDAIEKRKPNAFFMRKLSEREKQTALLVAEGKSNKEIAQALDITERTVKAHLSNIYQKTEVSDRFSLAKIVFD